MKAAWIMLLPFLLCACAGADTKVCFDSSEYPVSMSSYVPAHNGTHITWPRLKEVGNFSAEGRGYGILYSWLPLNDLDFSDELNAQIKEAGGHAVIELTVQATNSLWNFCPRQWVPLYPGNVHVLVKGKIVRDSQDHGR